MPDNQSLFPIEGLLDFKRDTYENTLSNQVPLAGLLTDMWEEGKLPFVPSPRGLPSAGLLYMMALDEEDDGPIIPEPEEGKRRLYNAGTIERDPQGYLEPHISDWVKEVAEGAGDVPVEDITSPLVYMSDEPDWVDKIVGRSIGKHPGDVTEEDIRKYGRLNVIDIDPEWAEIFSISSKEDEDLYSNTGNITRLSGEEVPFYETSLYDEGDVFTGEGRRMEMPVGPERKDWISPEEQEITHTLVGNELIKFLKKMKK